MLATEYAQYFNIEDQREDESGNDFRGRVAGELRAKNELIYANEAYYDKRIEYTGGDVMTGVVGAVAQALQGIDYGSKGARQLDDDFAAGVIATTPREDADLMALLAVLLAK